MPLADTFQEIVDSLPSDWTDLELDLRVQEDRYIDAATRVAQVNAQPYSNHDWHWRILVAHQFGHAAAAPPVHGTLKLLDDAGIRGELVAARLPHGPRRDDPDVGPPGVRAPGVPPAAVAVVASVVALFDDLLLGSNVLGMLRAAGHEARLTGSADEARPDGAAVLIVDLAQPGLRRRRGRRGRCARAASWGRRARSASTRTSTPTPSAAPTTPASTSSSRARGWRARGPTLVERLAGA